MWSSCSGRSPCSCSLAVAPAQDSSSWQIYPWVHHWGAWVSLFLCHGRWHLLWPHKLWVISQGRRGYTPSVVVRLFFFIIHCHHHVWTQAITQHNWWLFGQHFSQIVHWCCGSFSIDKHPWGAWIRTCGQLIFIFRECNKLTQTICYTQPTVDLIIAGPSPGTTWLLWAPSWCGKSILQIATMSCRPNLLC